jgi:drug/metabolite transporter (DMT)-like permease
MIVTKTPVIIPTRLEWLTLLAMIGIFGFIAQVRVATSSTQTEFGKLISSCAGAADDGPTTRDRWKRNHGSLHPSIVSLLRRSFDNTDLVLTCGQIVFATILERIFFHSVPTALSVIGTLLIMGSAIFVVVNKLIPLGHIRH